MTQSNRTYSSEGPPIYSCSSYGNIILVHCRLHHFPASFRPFLCGVHQTNCLVSSTSASLTVSLNVEQLRGHLERRLVD